MLKQTLRVWFGRFIFLLGLGFVSSKANSSLFVLQSFVGILLILICIDDIINIGSHHVQAKQLISQLGKEYFLNHLGQLHYFFIEVLCTKYGLFLTKPRNVLNLLAVFL